MMMGPIKLGFRLMPHLAILDLNRPFLKIAGGEINYTKSKVEAQTKKPSMRLTALIAYS